MAGNIAHCGYDFSVEDVPVFGRAQRTQSARTYHGRTEIQRKTQALTSGTPGV